MIKTIIFDLGGVLIDVDMPYCLNNIKALGVDVEALTKSSATVPASTVCEGITISGALHDYQIGKIPTEQFLSMLQELSAPGTTRQQVLDAWNSCLQTLPKYKLDFVKQLRDHIGSIFLKPHSQNLQSTISTSYFSLRKWEWQSQIRKYMRKSFAR